MTQATAFDKWLLSFSD